MFNHCYKINHYKTITNKKMLYLCLVKTNYKITLIKFIKKIEATQRGALLETWANPNSCNLF